MVLGFGGAQRLAVEQRQGGEKAQHVLGGQHQLQPPDGPPPASACAAMRPRAKRACRIAGARGSGPAPAYAATAPVDYCDSDVSPPSRVALARAGRVLTLPHHRGAHRHRPIHVRKSAHYTIRERNHGHFRLQPSRADR